MGTVLGFIVFAGVVFASVYVFPFRVLPALQKKKEREQEKEEAQQEPAAEDGYDQVIPGFGAKMRGCPFGMSEVAEVMSDMRALWHINFPDLSDDEIKMMLDTLWISWGLNDQSLTEEDERAVRHIRNENYPGSSMVRYISGDYQSGAVRVFYNEDDLKKDRFKRIGRGALPHELAHALDELLGYAGANADYDHRPSIYGPDGIVGIVKRKHS